MDFNLKINEYCSLIDNRLNEIFIREKCLQQVVVDAMKYSIMAGGKRIRPVLLLEFFRICGGNINDALNFACALEMIHTYSLIHDDLPCMDDDDMRRGKPSCHIAFGEANALLAGDALLNLAFETMLSDNSNISAESKIKAAAYIAGCSGVDGMIGGQVIDLENENNDISEEILIILYKDKTAALLRAATVSGTILAGADEKKQKAAEKFAINIGIAFQIIDDVLDKTADQSVLGKPVGSDEKNKKKTYVDFHGIETALLDAKKLTDEALTNLKQFNDTEFLHCLAKYLCERNK